MEENKARATAVLAIYDAEARGLLETIEAPDLHDIDGAAIVLRRALTLQRTLRVGFLGESQVGKSSIINALIGQRVLPSGGVGPLTAQATKIAYAVTPAVRVKYHARKRLNEFRFALQRYLESLGELSVAASEGDTESRPDDDSEDAFSAFDFSLPAEAEDGSGEAPRRVGEYLVSQTRLMLGVPSEVPRMTVFRLVRAIAAKDNETALLPDDPALRMRVLHIRRLLDTTEDFTRDHLGSKEFNAALRLRAAGWMSPLVSELHVTLDLPLLREAEIVDLPGVGVVADPAGRVAEEFVRKEADALVIVMRNNGLTEQVAGLLERTGVVSRLLWGARDAEASIHVAIVVTRLDDVAKERWRQRVLEARESGESPPRREDIFRELSEQMATMVRRQIAEALLNSREFDDLTVDLRAHREQVVRALSEKMTVLCVAAPDYLGLLENFDDDCFIRVPAETNVPRLLEQMTDLALRARATREEQLSSACATFSSMLDRSLNFQEHVRHDRKEAKTDADLRFRASLEAVATPLKADARRHRQQFLSFLADKMPPQLDALSERAAEQARKRLRRQTTEGARLTWSTLNAALIRNGSFQGAANIDYPGGLTSTFVDVVGSAFEQVVVDGVRAAFRQLNEADSALVERLAAAAAEMLQLDELDGTVGDLRRQLRSQGRASIVWTQAQLEELREDARVKLKEVVAKPIEKACRTAQKAGQNRGQGARNRILEIFDSGALLAIEEARIASVSILEEQLKRLTRSLGGFLRENYDPVTHLFDTIVDAQSELVTQLGETSRREQSASIQNVRRQLERLGAGALERATTGAADVAVKRVNVAAADGNVRNVGIGIFDDL
ncbi:MAG: dynamin family protein [Polyangiales bacterium]